MWYKKIAVTTTAKSSCFDLILQNSKSAQESGNYGKALISAVFFCTGAALAMPARSPLAAQKTDSILQWLTIPEYVY